MTRSNTEKSSVAARTRGYPSPAFLLAALILLSPAAYAQQRSITGYPVEIVAGDQLLFSAGNKRVYNIKLQGIQTPHLSSRLGQAAKRHLKTLIAGRLIEISQLRQPPGSAIIAKVSYGGSDISLRMLKAGLGIEATSELKDPAVVRRYKQAELQARNRKLGIWDRKNH